MPPLPMNKSIWLDSCSRVPRPFLAIPVSWLLPFSFPRARLGLYVASCVPRVFFFVSAIALTP